MLSLSKRRCDTLPEEIDGCEIDAGFRTILMILRLLNEQEDGIMAALEDALHFFYVDERPEDALDKMFDFIRGGDAPEENDEPPRMDWEFDAAEIYADFLAIYGIDLLESTMHWYTFLVMLGGIMAREGALSSKVHTRFMDLKGLKGKELLDAQRAKDKVQIPEKLTLEELEAEAQTAQAYEDEWGSI